MSEKYNLGIYLMKSSVTSSDEIIGDANGFNARLFEVDGCEAALYSRQTRGNPPGWMKLFRDEIPDLTLENKSTSAVLTILVDDRWFAIPFGYGWSSIDANLIESNFGLKCVLSLLEPEKIRSVDAFSLEAIRINQRIQASRTTTIDDMGVDIDKDLVSSATGSPDSDEYGNCISGKDSIKVTLSDGLDELPQLIRKIMEVYVSEAYKRKFPWIDHVSEIRDPSVVEILDSKIIAAIQDGNTDKVWLSIPEVIDWAGFKCFRFQQKKRGEDHDDILLDDYLTWLNEQDEEPSLDNLKKHKVHCIDEASEQPRPSWPIYRCLYGEVDNDGELYVITDGKWYLVNRDYLSQIERKITQIPKMELSLPDCLIDETEKLYNARVCNDQGEHFHLMDCDNIIYGGGHSRIEFCDILTDDKKIVHVKKYGGSSVLSHLFSQGVVSARLLKSDQDFRECLNRKLPAAFCVPIDRAPTYEEYEIIYAVISHDTGERPSLPLFSKIALATAHSNLTSFGYKVSIGLIHQNS